MVFPIPETLPYEVDSVLWGRQLKPDDADLTEIRVNGDITMWILNSQYRQYKEQRLWEEFQEWYQGWTEATFKLAHREALKLVRIQLILHGFQVRQTRGSISYAKALAELLLKDKPDERTKETLEEAERLKTEHPNMYDLISPKKVTQARTSPTADFRDPWERQIPPISFPQFALPDRPIQDEPQNPGYVRNLLPDLMKVYNDSEFKYSGGEYDFLEKKLQVFYELCRKVGLNQTQYESAFSTMLQGAALSFYFDRLSNQGLRFGEMIARMKAHFETEERRQKYLTEWRNTTFAQVIRKHPDKTFSEQLEKLFETLRTLQYGLVDSYQSELMLRDQVINACREVPECNFVLLRPAATYEGLCADLRNAIGQAERMRTKETYIADQIGNNLLDTEAYWTDRKYGGRGSYRNRGGQYRARGVRGRFIPSRLPSTNSFRRNRMSNQKCFVCKKPGCWSTNHPKEERKAKFSQYMMEQEMDEEIFEQYLLQYEGESDLQYEQNEISDENDNLECLQNGSSNNQLPQFETYFTEIGPVNGAYVAELLGRQALIHTYLPNDQFIQSYETEKKDSASNEIFHFQDRYSANIFQGIIPDTGASGVSTAGEFQVQALEREKGISRTTGAEHNIKFGKGSVRSQGDITVKTPVGIVTFFIVPTNTPFLMCLQDMDRLFVTLDNIANVLRQGNKTIPIVRKWGHPFMLLDQKEETSTYNHLTEVELRQIHRRFGHPSVRKLADLLNRAGHTDIDTHTIERLNKFCKHCQLHTKSPGRFKFTIKDDIEFNYSIILDVFYIDGNPVLHIVDEATAYNAAVFIRDMSTKTVWNAIRRCWIDTYLGPPDHISHDAGTNFASAEFRQNARSFQIDIREVPVEAHNAIGKVERYHAPIRRAYNIFKEELKDDKLDKESILQMAVKAVNDTAGPNGLVPTLLVYGAYPRMTSYDPPSPSILKRISTYRLAMKEVREIQAKRASQEALATRNGPDTYETLNLPLNSLVRVWRERKGWTGPYRLLAITNQNCTVDLPHGPTDFRTTVVKPFYEESSVQVPEQAPAQRTVLRVEIPRISPPQNVHVINDEYEQLIAAIRDNQDLMEVFVTKKEQEALKLAIELRTKGIITTEGAPFEASQIQEIDNLIARDVFEFVKYNPLVHTGRLFNSRLVNEVKGRTTETPYEKSRLVIQAYNDEGKESILTQAPTIQRSSQRIIIALAPTLAQMGIKLMVRDVTQAYVQSKTDLNRIVLAKLPKELQKRYPSGTIMIVKKPLYGIAEAGTHWWATYWKHHQEKLNMVTSSYDPCLLVTNTKGTRFGLVGMQTDDTLVLADQEFLRCEDRELNIADIKAKPGEYLTYDSPLVFNGFIIRQEEKDRLILTQKGQGKKIAKVVNPEQYREQRARGAYIATICQPEASYDLSVAAQHQDPSDNDIKLLNKRLDWQMKNLDRGLSFIPLVPDRMKLFIFVDGSFANNKDLSSQIGFVIVLANEEISDENLFKLKGNIIHYSSTKSKRVTRSVLASEIYAMVAGVDIGLAIRSTLQIITSQLNIPDIPVVLCTDSYSLYECLVKLGTTKEKRLMIDVMALRQAYERRELTEIRWINGLDNLADAMTKANPNKALEKFIDTNTLTIRVEGWVKRENRIKVD